MQMIYDSQRFKFFSQSVLLSLRYGKRLSLSAVFPFAQMYSSKKKIIHKLNQFFCQCSVGRNFNDGVLWMLLDGKAIELLTYVVILVLYIIIKKRLRAKVWNLFKCTKIFVRIIFLFQGVRSVVNMDYSYMLDPKIK